MSFVALPGLIGPLIGPTLGGWLVQAASWHWIFLINVPLGLVGTWPRCATCRTCAQPVSRFESLGYGLLAFGMVAVSLSLERCSGRPAASRHWCWCCWSSVSRARRVLAARGASARPLFPLALFKVHTFSVGLLGNLFSRMGSGGMPYLIPLLLQVALGLFADARRA